MLTSLHAVSRADQKPIAAVNIAADTAVQESITSRAITATLTTPPSAASKQHAQSCTTLATANALSIGSESSCRRDSLFVLSSFDCAVRQYIDHHGNKLIVKPGHVDGA